MGLLAVTGVAGVTLAGVDKEERKVREKNTNVGGENLCIFSFKYDDH